MPNNRHSIDSSTIQMFAYVVFLFCWDMVKMHTRCISTSPCWHFYVNEVLSCKWIPHSHSPSSIMRRDRDSKHNTLSKLVQLIANGRDTQKMSWRINGSALDTARIELISCIAEQSHSDINVIGHQKKKWNWWLEAAKWRYNMLSLLFPNCQFNINSISIFSSFRWSHI